MQHKVRTCDSSLETGQTMTLTQLTNEASRLLAAERATTNEAEAKRLQAERDRIETMIRDRYQALLKSH